MWRSSKMDTLWSAKKKQKKLMSCTKLLHHTDSKIWTLSRRGNLWASWHRVEKKKKPLCIKVTCLRPAVTFWKTLPRVHRAATPHRKQTRVKIRQCRRGVPVPSWRWFKNKTRRLEAPSHLRLAPPRPAKKPLSKSRPSTAVARRHHSSPRILWFRWYCNDKHRDRRWRGGTQVKRNQ